VSAPGMTPFIKDYLQRTAPSSSSTGGDGGGGSRKRRQEQQDPDDEDQLDNKHGKDEKKEPSPVPSPTPPAPVSGAPECPICMRTGGDLCAYFPCGHVTHVLCGRDQIARQRDPRCSICRMDRSGQLPVPFTASVVVSDVVAAVDADGFGMVDEKEEVNEKEKEEEEEEEYEEEEEQEADDGLVLDGVAPVVGVVPLAAVAAVRRVIGGDAVNRDALFAPTHEKKNFSDCMLFTTSLRPIIHAEIIRIKRLGYAANGMQDIPDYNPPGTTKGRKVNKKRKRAAAQISRLEEFLVDLNTMEEEYKEYSEERIITIALNRQATRIVNDRDAGRRDRETCRRNARRRRLNR
jgi:transcription elongation factor Elf1